MTEPAFPPVAQPIMRSGHKGEIVNAIIDNRTDLPDEQVRQAVKDQWVEAAGLQFAQPNNFQLYVNNQGSMLARTPFRTPTSVIDEIRLARTLADTDDDTGAAMGEMIAIAFGEGVVNQHRDEKTLEFFNQMTAPKAMDLEHVLEELYREYLIAASVTTVTLFTRKRMQYWPLKSDEPVQAQLQVPNVGILPAENVRVITNDIIGGGELAYYVEDQNLKMWLNEYLDPKTNGQRKAIMAMMEPVVAALFTGKIQIPYNDGDVASRGMTLYTLNQRMVHRTTMPKGSAPYPRPLLTRNFALIEAKRLLNIMDYCVPTDSEILTLDGWKSHDQVTPGDYTVGINPATGRSEWTRVTGVHHTDAPVVELVNGQHSLRSTANHRWFTHWRDWRRDGTQHAGFKATDEITSEHYLHLAAPLDSDGSRLSPREAAIVAWVLCDGTVQRGDGGVTHPNEPKFEASIYQAKDNGCVAIEALLETVPHSVYQKTETLKQYRLAPAFTRELWAKARLDEEGPESLVWHLGTDALDAFLQAALDAEGHVDRRGGKLISQNDGPVQDAIRLAAFLLGHLTTLPTAGRECKALRLKKATIKGASFERRELPVQPVWCVETELGSWTMRQGGGIYLTGNSLLQGGTNYIVLAKKGSDLLPAQQGEVDNLIDQVSFASRSGVMVGDHRLQLEIITPKLDELLNPAKRKLIGRKLKMGLMRQTEEVPNDSGTQGGVNEMELTARVVSADRRKLVRHVQATFYDETATRNRAIFKMGAPSIWAPKIVLSNVALFWTNVLQARDRGDIPRRWVVEALGYDYDAALAEREREIARGDDEILMPGAVPFSNPGEPQDNSPGRPAGTSTNNGTNQDRPGQGRDPAAPRKTVHRNAGETIKAIVEGGEVHYVGETTAAILDEYADHADYNAYVTQAERDCIDFNQVLRSGPSVIVPVNSRSICDEFACVKLEDGLRMVVGRRIGDGAMIARALRFTEPHWDLRGATERAIRWGFMSEPLVENAAGNATCTNCGVVLADWPGNTVCPTCGTDNTQGGPGVGQSNAEGVSGNVEMGAQLASMREALDRIALELPRPAETVWRPVEDWSAETYQAPSQEEREAFQKVHGKDSGVSLKKDKDGFFVHTHRARSKSHAKPGDIPKADVKFIESTG